MTLADGNWLHCGKSSEDVEELRVAGKGYLGGEEEFVHFLGVVVDIS